LQLSIFYISTTVNKAGVSRRLSNKKSPAEKRGHTFKWQQSW
jgi:hypothetical protein